MGLADRRPILPAPTDSAIGSADEAPIEQDLATELSRITDLSHVTIPDDGTPITIPTVKKRSGVGKLLKPGNHSQTSLLIEYFEAGSGSERKPSFRVKLSPSNSQKSTVRGEGHTLNTEVRDGRQPSASHHIQLHPGQSSEVLDASNFSSLPSEIAFGQARDTTHPRMLQESELSKLSGSPEARYIVPESDISSMPPDSILEVSHPPVMGRSIVPTGASREDLSEKENLKPPVFPTGRNLSQERITQKVIEKLSNKPRSATGNSMISDKSRSQSSVSREIVGATDLRNRTAKQLGDESVTGTASSMVSGSLLSADAKSVDHRSVRSGHSTASINNPKLLQTVEDAIRRLILPELKEIKQDQRHTSQRRRKDYPAELSESSVSREEVSRRKSSGSKGRRRSSREHGHRTTSGSKKLERSAKTVDYDSPSEESYRHSESIESTSIDGERKPRKHHKSHRTRDMAAAGLAGAALTAAALKHHESGSSLDHRERRKKRSKSRSSRSASVAESEDAFNKHDIPPMPMRSEVDSELTRSSLLSSNTNGTATPTHREVREVIRGSPYEMMSPSSQTPSRTPVQKSSPDKTLVETKRGLGMHHGNLSSQDLAIHRDEHDEEEHLGQSPESYKAGFGAIGHGLLMDPERAKAYESNLHHQHPIRRGLSPIQSVASYATTEPNRNSMLQPRSEESLSSVHKDHQLKNEISIASMSSAPSTDLAKSQRPQGISLENRSEVMFPHKAKALDGSREIDADDFFDEQHSQNDHYRDSFDSEGPKIPLQHMSNYTDDSADAPYLDKVVAGQQLARGYGANPEYIHTPPGVESAVASLYDPSVLDIRGTQSPRMSHGGSLEGSYRGSPRMSNRDVASVQSGSPLKQQLSDHNEHFGEARGISPPQSAADSDQEYEHELEKPSEAVEAVPATTDKDATSPESEITTNPSVIQGPIGGYPHGDRDHWPYGPTPPPAERVLSSSRDLGVAGADLVPEPLSMVPPPQKNEVYTIGGPMTVTPPVGKDEGYETGANAPSPAAMPRNLSVNPAPAFPMEPHFDDAMDDEDPFTQKRNQYMSGLSQGMSPLYDGATGRGIDRIQSKDVVALMDHLTVRDAQRNARDTEILVTLVRTAAEMRNSFEDMKKFMSEQGDMILDTSDKQHEKTQRAIGGPRPQPQSMQRVARTPASEDDDLPAKRRNVFKRALQGLGTKNTQELQNIEGMLMQLLNDVEGLRTLHTSGPSLNEPRSTSINSAEHSRLATDPGYEPEGQAGTSSTGGRSGIFSNNSSRQANYRGVPLIQNGNRVSTVMEGDEEYDDQDDMQPNQEPEQTTPRATFAEQPHFVRGASEPFNTPPRSVQANQGSMSNENTPQADTGSSKKHKSFASSFLPKMVSRWSKTTASSGGDYRNSTQPKTRPYSQVSRSGSHLDEYDYDPQGDDRIRSNTSLQNDQTQRLENRPPSPLVPSQVSDNPKYSAVRNSINLQHPQPRQGPTGRYQHRLESEAQYYPNDPTSPTSVTSSQWEHQAALSGMPGAGPNGAYMHGGQLSPILDAGYSETSEAMMDRDRPADAMSYRSTSSSSRQGPPRPPKVPDDDPLVPPRPPKELMTPPGSRQVTYVDHVAAARSGSPAFDRSPAGALRSSPGNTRKPSGPRPLSGSGHYGKGQKGDFNTIKKTRFRGSPNQIDSDDGHYVD